MNVFDILTNDNGLLRITIEKKKIKNEGKILAIEPYWLITFKYLKKT